VFLSLRTKRPRRDGVVHVAVSQKEIDRIIERNEGNDWGLLEIPFGCSFVSPREPVDKRQQRFGSTIERSQKRGCRGFLTLTREDLGLENEDLPPRVLSQHIVNLLSGAYGDKTFFADITVRAFIEFILYIETVDSALSSRNVRLGESRWFSAARRGCTKPFPSWLDKFVIRYVEEQAGR